MRALNLWVSELLTTLWTDYQYQPQDNTLEIALNSLCDYREIYYDNRLLTPQDTVAIH